MSQHYSSAAWKTRGLGLVRKSVLVLLSESCNHHGLVAATSVAHLADELECSERTVQRHLKDLESMGLISRAPVSGGMSAYVVFPKVTPDSLTGISFNDPRQRVTPQTGGGDSVSPPKSALPVPKTQVSTEINGDDSILTVYKSSNKELKKEQIRSKSKFGADDWQTKYAAAFWSHFDKAGLLAPRLKDGPQTLRDRTIDEWASELDKIVRIDKYTPDDILAVARWLFDKGNWWTEKGNIRTVNKLRTKNGADERYFDIMFAQMKGSSRITFDADGVLTESQMKELCRVRGLTESDFWRRGTDARTGEPIYQLRKDHAA